jgi:uncharacterized membrane protein
LAFYIILLYMVESFSRKAFLLLTGDEWLFAYYLLAALFLGSKNITLGKNREDDLIMLNVGGALVPLLTTAIMAIGLLRELGLFNGLISLVLVISPAILVAYLFSQYRKGIGVVSSPIVLPLCVTGVTSFVFFALSWFEGGAVAPHLIQAKMMLGFIASTVGTLIGCDLLRLPEIGNDGRRGDKPSMGGAGIFDGVFISGIITMGFLM